MTQVYPTHDDTSGSPRVLVRKNADWPRIGGQELQEMLTIESASLEDAPTMLDIQRRAFAEEGRRVGSLEDGQQIPPLAESLESIIEHIQTQTALVARDDERIVGAVRFGASSPIRRASSALWSSISATKAAALAPHSFKRWSGNWPK